MMTMFFVLAEIALILASVTAKEREHRRWR